MECCVFYCVLTISCGSRDAIYLCLIVLWCCIVDMILLVSVDLSRGSEELILICVMCLKVSAGHCCLMHGAKIRGCMCVKRCGFLLLFCLCCSKS